MPVNSLKSKVEELEEKIEVLAGEKKLIVRKATELEDELEVLKRRMEMGASEVEKKQDRE